MWPRLLRVESLRDFANLPERTLLHAGPPFAAPEHAPAPILQSAALVAVAERMAADVASARAALVAGDIALAPAQDYGVVVPLAFIAGPSVPGLVVGDAGAGGDAVERFSPLNDGPPPAALRFGTGSADGLSHLAAMGDVVAPALRSALAAPIDVVPLMAAGLAGGDDLHGRVASAQSAMREALPPLGAEAEVYLDAAGQFVLNLLMAAAAVILARAGEQGGADMVIAAGGNGVDFGYKTAAAPDRWVTRPATIPEGPRFGPDKHETLPAIGDSAVLDVAGFGAAALRFSPELVTAYRGLADPAYETASAHAPFRFAHPDLPFEGLALGLDLARIADAPVLGVQLAALDAHGEKGIIGRGIAPWPRG
ncbi:hypothetical protein DLJ53_03360 [Acuticoccus sediminis]|uniref:DUF1116 domain-containing protein n=1 Tax=Acuticoccus sediminis TaxID=2184697 RepID=A0A8B2NVZ5_9HYPH|nr:DUF1116 domain-containing protein [Acuticoccus sediminis]RAI03543.1 hypothetical protein DLJ53_03360 [Acuticoccus sediminis]